METNDVEVNWSQCYETALRRYIGTGPSASVQPAAELGRQAVALGMETLDIARIHKEFLENLVRQRDLSPISTTIIKQANGFFAETIIPIEQPHHAVRKTVAGVHAPTGSLQARLRLQMRRILSLQEDERLLTNRCLYDEVAQTVLAIHLKLARQKTSAPIDPEELGKEADETQYLLNQSGEKTDWSSHEFDIRQTA